MLLNCFYLLMFQGVGFLHLKLPQLTVLLDYFVKQTNKPDIRQSVFTDNAWLCMLFCAVWSSIDILFRPKFLSNCAYLNLHLKLGCGGQIVVLMLPTSLLFFPLKP